MRGEEEEEEEGEEEEEEEEEEGYSVYLEKDRELVYRGGEGGETD